MSVPKHMHDHPILNRNRGKLVSDSNNSHGSTLLLKWFAL